MKPAPLTSARRGRRGFALVIVLIIICVLALVAVGYLSSMSQERATSNAFGNKARAEQSAQAGADTAMGILRDYFAAFPDSATVWEPLSTNSDGTTNDGTSLYFHAVATNNLPNANPNPGDTTANSTSGNGPNNFTAGTTTTAGTDNRSIFVLPLTSGQNPVLAVNHATLPAVPAMNTNTYVDLNARRYLGDDQGWLGTPPDYTYPTATRLPRPVRVPWVEVQQQDGVANGSTPPVVARYAFWVEDESFRANVSYGNATALTTRSDNSTGAGPTPSLKPLLPTDLNLVSTLTTLGDGSPSTTAANLVNVRNTYPGTLFPESAAFAHTAGLNTLNANGTTTANALRFLTTPYSSALNLSRHGTQRLNLNSIVPQTPNATQQTMQTQINQLVAALQFHLPNFGERFYRTVIPTTYPPASPNPLNLFTVPPDPAASSTAQPYRLIYNYKVAANIRDYIDPDPIPTIINAKGYLAPGSTTPDPGGTVRYGYRQTLAFENYASNSDGPNEIWAQGKDSAPFIDECAMRVRGGPGHNADNTTNSDPTHYTLAIDFYVEVWNMSNVDVPAANLGPHPVLRIVNPSKWIAMPGGGDLTTTDSAPTNASPSGSRNVVPPQRDYDIDLSSVTFKAGVATVITTDTDFSSTYTSLKDYNGSVIFSSESASHVYVCGFYNAPGATFFGKRVFNGPMPTGTTSIQMLFGGDGSSNATSSSDYETEIILTTDNGAIDTIEGGMPIYNNNSAISLTTGSGTTIGNTLFGGHLHGNNYTTYPAVTGDPRGNNEQLEYELYRSGSAPDETRYFNPTAAAPLSFGLPDLNYIVPAGNSSCPPWPDYYTFPSSPYAMSAANAPAVIANSALTSIGQLGDVYDPARYQPTSGGAIVQARGGGRTFKIGQHDDLWDGDPTSASRTWASWRLADFFSVSDAMDQPGLVNINGVARDNGAALRAALTGLVYQTTTASLGSMPQPAGKTLTWDITQPGLQSVINEMRARLATPLTSPATTYSLNPKQSTSNPFVGSKADCTGSGPFFERGELSELPAFGQNAVTASGGTASNITASTDLISTVNMATAFDREREELFRRLAEMITTRGDVFTVYAIGESLVPVAASSTAARQVTGTQQLRITFKLVPKNIDGTKFFPALDASGAPRPLDPANPNTRFSKPDHYDVQVLSATTGSR